MAPPPIHLNLPQRLNREASITNDQSSKLPIPPIPPASDTRIYMLIRQIAENHGLEEVKTTYRLSRDQSPLDPLYKWSEAMSTPFATVWAGVVNVSHVSCKIIACDFQIGNHSKEVMRKDSSEAYTSLVNCSRGSFQWEDGTSEYDGGMDRISSTLNVKQWSEAELGTEDKRSIAWDVVHVDVPTPPGGTTGFG